MKRLALVGMTLGLALAAVGGVFDDAKAWYRGGRDANGDGKFQKGEWRDVKRLATSDSPMHQADLATSSAAAEVPGLVRAQVVCPYRNVTLENQPCLQFAVPTVTNSMCEVDGQEWPVVSTCPNNLILPNFLGDWPADKTCDAYTAVLRFRYDAPVSEYADQQTAVAHFGFKWASGGGSGIALCLVRSGDQTPERRRMQYFCGGLAQTDAQYWSPDVNGTLYPYVYPGNWVDVAVRVKGRELTIAYTWADDCGGTCSPTNRHLRFWRPTVGAAYDPAIASDKRAFRLGGESVNGSALTYTNMVGKTNPIQHNALKSFRGLVHQYAFWDRALSDDEIREAFGRPNPSLLSVGVEGNGVGEFAATTTVVHADASWEDLDPVLKTKGSSLQVKFDVPKLQSGFDHLLRIGFASRPTAATLPKVMLNGVDLGPNELAVGDIAHWHVRGAYLTEGENTLELIRTDELAGDLAVDFAELGVSWQRGELAGNKFNDYFVHENNATNHVFLEDGNWFHFKRGISGGGMNRTQTFRFRLPADVGGQYRMTFESMFDGWSGASVHDVDVSVNGLKFTTLKDVVSRVPVKVEFPASAFQAGMNEIELYKVDAGGWVNNDGYRLTVRRQPKGFVLLFR